MHILVELRENARLLRLPPRALARLLRTRAASGHAMAAPPMSVMNWRRLTPNMESPAPQ